MSDMFLEMLKSLDRTTLTLFYIALRECNTGTRRISLDDIRAFYCEMTGAPIGFREVRDKVGSLVDLGLLDYSVRKGISIGLAVENPERLAEQVRTWLTNMH
jgi:hypothetical protein